MTLPIAEFRAFLGGMASRYSDEQMLGALLRTRPAAEQYSRDEHGAAIAKDDNGVPVATVAEKHVAPEDVKDLKDARVEGPLAETLAKEFPADKEITRADFRYRESADWKGKDHKTPRCANCLHYAEDEKLPDRLGTCGMFEHLAKANSKRFQLMEDVGAHAVCDAWSGELNEKHGRIAAESLARHFADSWNALRAMGGEPSIEESEHVDDELDGSGWGVNWSDGEWSAIEYPDQFYDQGEPRSAKGGVTVSGKSFRAGTWLPLDPAQATPEEAAKIRETKTEEIRRLMQRKQKLAATPVNRQDLQAKVEPAANVQLGDPEIRSIDYGYRALKRHHGEQVWQRLSQLINGLVERMGDGQAGEQGDRLMRRLAAYRYMLERAEADFPEAKESNAPVQ